MRIFTYFISGNHHIQLNMTDKTKFIIPVLLRYVIINSHI